MLIIFRYWLIFSLLLLTGCGKASFDADDLSISGSLSIAQQLMIDSDTNDINAPYADNNDPARPQAVLSSQQVSGFASAVASQGDASVERFARQPDTDDYFKVSLTANQTIRLQVLQASDENDLDLFVFRIGDDSAVGSSLNHGEQGKIESVKITMDGEYLVLVQAAAGASTYMLDFLPEPDESTRNVVGQFRSYQAVVQYQASPASGNARSTLAIPSKPSPVKLSFKPQDRALLSRSTSNNALADYNPLWHEKLETLLEVKRLNRLSDVEFAEPNFIRHPLKVANDTYYGLQTNLEQISLPAAWNISTGASANDVIVAVIDSGVFLAHEDLQGQLIAGYDFISDIDNSGDGDGLDDNPDDPGDQSNISNSSWHGTHVAGIIAAKSNNELGVAGVSWGAKIMPLRASGYLGADSYDVAQAILYATKWPNGSNSVPNRRADIINISLGSTTSSTIEQQAINTAVNQGVLVVAAAGNDGAKVHYYPAAYPNVIAVAATNPNGQQASYSNYGSFINIAAPGGDGSQNILSTFVEVKHGVRNSGYAYSRGTSMAAPHVTGVLALMKAVNPNLTRQQIKAGIESCLITKNKSRCSFSEKLGYGEIDAFRALEFAQNPEILLSSNGRILLAEPQRVSLKASETVTIKLTNLGQESISEIQASFKQPDTSWFSINNLPTQLNRQSSSSFQIHLNAQDLPASLYENTLVINFVLNDTEREIEIPIRLDLRPLPQNQPNRLYLKLCAQQSATTENCLKQQTSGNGKYTFDHLAAGKYKIYASTDINADGVLCEVGEACVITAPFNLSKPPVQHEKNLELRLIIPNN